MSKAAVKFDLSQLIAQINALLESLDLKQLPEPWAVVANRSASMGHRVAAANGVTPFSGTCTYEVGMYLSALHSAYPLLLNRLNEIEADASGEVAERTRADLNAEVARRQSVVLKAAEYLATCVDRPQIKDPNLRDEANRFLDLLAKYRRGEALE